MLKEINYKELFVSKLNCMEENKEVMVPVTDARFVTKSVKRTDDVLTGTSFNDNYVSFNPDKKDRGTDFDRMYYNYMNDLYLKQGQPTNVIVSFADSIILNHLDALAELQHITQPGFLNKCNNIGHNPVPINKVYPDNNIKSVFDDATKSWSHHKNYDLNRFAKDKIGLDLNICDDDAIINLANQKYSRFCNGGQDNNIKLVEELPGKVLASAQECGMLDSDGRPTFFTEANKNIFSINNRLRLHGQVFDLFDEF